MKLIMAVKSAFKLVIEGRGSYCNDNLKHLYYMIELFLLLRGKLFGIDDSEIQTLMLNDWHLHPFIKGFIQALMSSKKFGGFSENYHKEIEVGNYTIICNQR